MKKITANEIEWDKNFTNTMGVVIAAINKLIELVNMQQEQIDDLIKSRDYNNENPL